MSLAAVCATEGYTFKLQVSNNVSKSHKCCVCVVVVFFNGYCREVVPFPFGGGNENPNQPTL